MKSEKIEQANTLPAENKPLDIDRVRRELAEAAKTYKPRNKPWSADEDKLLADFYGQLPTRLLADKMGRTAQGLCERAAVLGLSFNRARR